MLQESEKSSDIPNLTRIINVRIEIEKLRENLNAMSQKNIENKVFDENKHILDAIRLVDILESILKNLRNNYYYSKYLYSSNKHFAAASTQTERSRRSTSLHSSRRPSELNSVQFDSSGFSEYFTPNSSFSVQNLDIQNLSMKDETQD